MAGYVEGLSFEQFQASSMVQDAVERCLARITEAAIRAGDEVMASVAQDVPTHVYRGFGNALRHDYDQIDLQTIWLTALKDLLRLAEACRAILSSED